MVSSSLSACSANITNVFFFFFPLDCVFNLILTLPLCEHYSTVSSLLKALRKYCCYNHSSCELTHRLLLCIHTYIHTFLGGPGGLQNRRGKKEKKVLPVFSDQGICRTHTVYFSIYLLDSLALPNSYCSSLFTYWISMLFRSNQIMVRSFILWHYFNWMQLSICLSVCLCIMVACLPIMNTEQTHGFHLLPLSHTGLSTGPNIFNSGNDILFASVSSSQSVHHPG